MNAREKLVQEYECFKKLGQRMILHEHLLACGELFDWSPRPVHVELGEAKMCYANTTHLVIDNPHLRYCEGVMHDPNFFDGRLLIPHAWAITEDDTVIDPTLPRDDERNMEGTTYFGQVFPVKAICKFIVESRTYGVFGDFGLDWLEFACEIAGIPQPQLQEGVA